MLFNLGIVIGWIAVSIYYWVQLVKHHEDYHKFTRIVASWMMLTIIDVGAILVNYLLL